MTGQTFAHYEILEKLGAGGMGVVYRARDTRLERTVAIKVMGARLPGDETARARLLREARTASALNHPNICTIYEVGEADGQVYIAMEFVEGRPLGALVPTDGLPAETVLRYGTQIADALAHAHEHSIVHRDLKSSNVMVTPQGRTKVLDFGLAKRLTQAETDATRTEGSLTQAGSVIGTLHYMPPEVLRGESADARADLWALGVMLYEMAGGKLPFQGKTGFEITSAILRETPAPLPPSVSAGLRGVIQRCLAKEPAQRYQFAVEVRAALEALQSAPVPVAHALAGSRRRWLWALVPLLVLAVGGPLALRERKTAAPFGAPSGPRLSTGGVPSKIPEANEYLEKALLFMKTQAALPRGREMLERALQIDPRFAEARAWYGFSHVLMFENLSNDTSWLSKAEEEIRRALQDDPNCGRAHSALAAAYLYQGRKDLVPAEEEKALQLNPNDVDVPIWLAYYHMFNGDYAQALALLKKLMDREPLFLIPRMNFAINLRQLGDTAGAMREIEKVVEQAPQSFRALSVLARILQDAGELPKARQALEGARPADRQTYFIRFAWAAQLALEGKRKETLKEMDDDALKYAEASIFFTLLPAEIYAVLGDKAKSLEWLERAVRAGDERAEWFGRDPLLANVRREPRFQQILDSIAFHRQQRSARPK